jgi:hypothetical protein
MPSIMTALFKASVFGGKKPGTIEGGRLPEVRIEDDPFLTPVYEPLEVAVNVYSREFEITNYEKIISK